MKAARPVLMLVTEPCARLGEIVAEAVAGGVDLVQLRDRSAAPDCLHETATLLRFVTAAGGARLVVNGDWGVARAVGAEGLHLPEGGPGVREARAALARGAVVGQSVHSIAAARRAADADYLVAGTIFASASHPGTAPAGLEFLRSVCAAVAPLPVLAIGGVTPERVASCLAAGAAGVAVLSPLMRAADPRAAATAFRQEMERCSN